ncbi:hypothetical protein Tco_0842109 [Tanacetum coccineum]|uniref:Uncharacterized protein n=1 Tax=Tanacetum coccineum TaxID=301880 RepID=A0ABQ5B1T1_9ASTR
MTIRFPYHQYLLDTEAQNVPTEVSADTSDKVSMIAILTDLQTQLDGHAKVNQEKCLEIETLNNELLQCKQEICRLDTHKVKLDLENKVRQEQALKDLSGDQAYWLSSANEIAASYASLLRIALRRILRSACDKGTPKVLNLKLELSKQKTAILLKSEKNANTHSRTAYTEKLSALTTEHTKLQAQVTGKTSSGPSTSETPKVLAPGMYNLGSKYIPPPKRANWVKPTPLPKKRQGRVKPTSGASKTVPKRAPRNHSSLPAKSANARRVEAPHRTLNKQNRVDSNLLVKHSVLFTKLEQCCGACNKSLVLLTNECLDYEWRVIHSPKMLVLRRLVQIVLWYLDSGMLTRNNNRDRAASYQRCRKVHWYSEFGNDEYAAIVV